MTVLTDVYDRALSLPESSACSSRGDGGLVWSGLQSQRPDLGSLLDRHPYRVRGRMLQREDCRKTPNVCFVLDLNYSNAPSILSAPGIVIGLFGCLICECLCFFAWRIID